jgi:2,4-dienoyl-CoA reductase-like NADH-dependent reductase (Old Yellow Enzyme family)
VTVEQTAVEPAGRITRGCLGLYSDVNEAALARVVGFCRRAGPAPFGIQLPMRRGGECFSASIRVSRLSIHVLA